MDKLQAYNSFWNSFALTAYNEASVPSDAVMPYITYECMADGFDRSVALTASVWYRSTSWAEPVAKTKEIEQAITRGGVLVTYDGGAFWIRKASPWMIQMSDDLDDSVRRTILNVEVEFID